MYRVLKLILLLFVVSAELQDPRKRYLSSYPLDEIELNKNDDEDMPCATGMCVKRSSGQEELGPFWANRGKKDPSYMQEPLYASEPYWVFLRKDELNEPFFTSRGKKDTTTRYFSNNNGRSRDRREFMDMLESPFFASRGKKLKFMKNRKL